MKKSRSGKNKLLIDTRGISQANAMISPLFHPANQRIIESLQLKGSTKFDLLKTSLKLEAALLLSRLRDLQRFGIIKTERIGGEKVYRLNQLWFSRVSGFVQKLTGSSEVERETHFFNPGFTHKVDKPNVVYFSDLELKIIRLICEELETEEIADQLGLTEKSVRNAEKTIIKKMGVKNTVGILLFAIKKKMLRLKGINNKGYVDSRGPGSIN